MLKRKGKIISVVAALLIIILLITSVFVLSGNKNNNKTAKLPDLSKITQQMSVSSTTADYDAFLLKNTDISKIEDEILLSKSFVIEDGSKYSVNVETAECLASMELKYRILSDNDSDCSVSVNINNALQYKESSGINLSQQWTVDKVNSDKRGNQYSPELVKSTNVLGSILYDNTGYYTEPLVFRFEKGNNVITLISERGKIEIESIRLFSYELPGSYKEVSAKYPKSDNNSKSITVQAELPYIRTNASIAEICDRTSLDTSPRFSGVQAWNSIGGSGWEKTGETVSWKINVKESGCYKIAFRYKNDFTSGISSYRKLLIDNEIPFNEMNSVQFPYDSDWRVIQISDEKGNPYLFYLPKGEHLISLTVTLGEQAEALNVARKSLSKLNEAYRKIVMVTGANPDQYRDYQVKKKLPDVIEMLKEQKEILSKLQDWLLIKNDGKGEGTSTVEKLIWQIKEYINYPETIPQTIGTFSSNITSLSDWIQSRTSQPLTLDTLEVLSDSNEPYENESNFFEKLFYDFSLFLKSFSEDYGVIGDVYDGDSKIDVWLSLGRDQYQIIKEHTDYYFTPEYDTGVNLKLVAGGILEATVAGIEPDVYLFCDNGMPVNFASRGAVANLAEFKYYKEVESRFSKEAIVPYRYGGGVYGIPITQSFYMMFARDDILSEIGLEVPQTWDDLYNCLTILQQNNMEFAFPVPSEGYTLFLFQKQKNLYKDGGKSVDIDSENGIWAFEKWTKLYSEYSASMSYSFVNRFRTGDMPIGIVDFSTFNTLEVSAPEINGLWSMYPVPGTKLEDGTIQHISQAFGTGAIILKTSEKKNEAWNFIKWFTDEAEQYRYATAIENRQGISGRFSTANIKAFNKLSWTSSALKMLNTQRKTAYEVEQVPGGYFLSRHINNIFRKVVNQNANVRETVYEYANTINKEIIKKRKEFGLEVD